MSTNTVARSKSLESSKDPCMTVLFMTILLNRMHTGRRRLVMSMEHRRLGRSMELLHMDMTMVRHVLDMSMQDRY